MEHLRAAVREIFDNVTGDDAVDVYTVVGAVLVRYPAADRASIEEIVVDEISNRARKGAGR